ncbi:ATP-binding protein [Streptomyces sp. NPDC054796]
MHEYMSRVRIWELTCPGLREEVARARRWARDILSDSPRADDAALILSELVSNALLHTSSGNGFDSFHVHLVRSPSRIAISVSDSGGAASAPHVEHPDGTAATGRGLALVHAMAHHVHVHGDGRYGYTVTAELREDGDTDKRPSC